MHSMARHAPVNRPFLLLATGLMEQEAVRAKPTVLDHGKQTAVERSVTVTGRTLLTQTATTPRVLTIVSFMLI